MLKKIFLYLPFLLKVYKKLVQLENFLLHKWVSSSYKRLMKSDWGYVNSEPEFFDHHIDLYYGWLNTRSSFWLERGVWSSMALKGGKVLELSCGDGFNARNFYSLRSKEVVACDFDKGAMALANSKNQAPNLSFILADIRTNMPEGNYENIIWDAAIEHFTEDEIQAVIENIKKRLSKDGILSGYTIVEKETGEKSLHTHEYEFKSKKDLFRFFEPHFKNIKVFETIYSNRHNLYFWASDGVLPLSVDCENTLTKQV